MIDPNVDLKVPPEFDILSSGERPSFEEWDAIVRLLAAGFSTASLISGDVREGR